MEYSLINRVGIKLLLALALARGDNDPNAKLVDLNVVVVDKKGQPVDDLTASDFEVTDAGKRHPIAFFRHNNSKVREIPPLGANEFSNRGGATASHATLVLFDLLNERFGTRGFAANQIVHEFETMEAADDLYLYLLTLDGRLYAVHGLPGMEGEARQPGGAPWTRGIKPMMDAAIRKVAGVRPFEIDVYARIQLTLNSLDEVAAQLSRFPGRKNVVWVTDGVPISLGPQRSYTDESVDFTPQLRRLSDWFDRCGVAIYPVRQVMLGSPEAMGAAYGSGVGSAETLDQLAGLTGGRPTGAKDVGAAVRQAISDVRTSYQIGYYSPEENWDRKFHKLRVTCTRKGVHVQAKSGYYAWPETREAEAQQAINGAMSTAFDAAEIGIRGVFSIDPKDKLHANVAMRIEANDVALAREGDGYAGQLMLAVAGYMADGRAVSSLMIPMDIHYSPNELDQALKTGISFHNEIPLGEGVNKVRVVIFDYGSNAVGSVTIPVEGR
jgi:VWFA-related protein